MDDEAIRCPRCDEGMQSYRRRGPQRAAVTADMCDGCGGVWLDGKEVEAIYPGFAGLADRIAAAPVAACPRCAAPPIAFRFFELTLDVCAACHGLWGDGEELADLARTADRAEGLPAPSVGERGYRDHAASAVRTGKVVCKRCQAAVPVATVEPTSAGPMCRACAEAFRDERLDAALADYEPPTEPLVDLSFFADVARGLPLVLGAAIAAQGTCPRCHCASVSRCRC
jgi:Zn-finger nucleic acid-binding protein